MKKLIVHDHLVTKENLIELVSICPFHALEEKDGKLSINEGCKMCSICVKRGPQGVMEMVETEEESAIDKSQWQGIAVYVDHVDGKIHPVTLELLGKAKELAEKVKFPVIALFIGSGIKNQAEELLHYGADKVYVYDHKELQYFRIEPYAKAFEAFIHEVKPSSILVGATTIGRSLAPRIAARFKTGLTADCTVLEIKENSDLVQIRPAFGGNIMAQIKTPNTRPQLATVRYKVMNAIERMEEVTGEVLIRTLPEKDLVSRIEVLEVREKETEISISDAETIIAVGRGVKSEKDMALVKELAELLGAQIAGTRPLVESGWIEAKRQVGLSGRTVKPKLMITLGISGSVQFAAGMNGSEHIFAINNDENASIFNVAHYGIVGDLYEVLPQLIENVRKTKGA
ncbi:MAG TPA: electron transfer flavoprotein subunit alpha [Proteiniclasticum sp.]|jgi:electron transfer flavoprotein alpha subunit|uniref:electron transfer flavoprotein subunit alpha/FixB family protein n=1 Tax=Proteiniclasticum sp. TaxID=2053595 RepID=UPI000E942A55|nr:electron transfer flavoprotein subunit alpha/FixB family protein [Proteiniclasticum sp.]HBW13627.1 electron transfer flavoprotein subunit alpha [Proteiniclasticum sp.]